MDEDQLKELLKGVGFVWKLDIPRDQNGKTKGFGFAYFTTHNNAKNAIAQVNGQKLSGRTVSVDWALSKTQYKEKHPQIDEKADRKVQNLLKSFIPDNSGSEDEAMEVISEQEAPDPKTPPKTKPPVKSKAPMTEQERQDALTRTLFVSGLALDVFEDSLSSYMSQFGPLNSMKIVMNKLTGKSKGKKLKPQSGSILLLFRYCFCRVQ